MDVGAEGGVGEGVGLDEGSESEFMTRAEFELMCSTTGQVVTPECEQGYERARQRKRDGAARVEEIRAARRERKNVGVTKIGLGKLHSTHSCYGRDYTKDNWKRATCLYHDMCVHNNQFYYIVESKFAKSHVQNDHKGDNHIDVMLAPQVFPRDKLKIVFVRFLSRHTSMKSLKLDLT